MKFGASKLYISVIPVLVLGVFIGFLSAIMGVGGGFIMVPAMIYLLKVPTNVVVGTSLFQIIFVSAYTTVIHATANHTVDIVLAACLMIGGVIGAQYGANIGQKLEGRTTAFVAGFARSGCRPADCLRSVCDSGQHLHDRAGRRMMMRLFKLAVLLFPFREYAGIAFAGTGRASCRIHSNWFVD